VESVFLVERHSIGVFQLVRVGAGDELHRARVNLFPVLHHDLAQLLAVGGVGVVHGVAPLRLAVGAGVGVADVVHVSPPRIALRHVLLHDGGAVLVAHRRPPVAPLCFDAAAVQNRLQNVDVLVVFQGLIALLPVRAGIAALVLPVHRRGQIDLRHLT